MVLCYFRKIKKNYLFLYLIAIISTFIICKLCDLSENYTKYNVMNSSRNDIEKILSLARIDNTGRIVHIERVCRKYKLGKYKNKSFPSIYKEPPTPHYELFFYDLKYKLSWCPIYKAGSSTWLYNLAILHGFSEEEITNSQLQINDFVRKVIPPLESSKAKHILKNSLKFMIVRHPFERILSAYRDKLENIAVRSKDGTHYFYKKYGAKIVAKYRNNSTIHVQNILKVGQYLWNDTNSPTGIEPTFKEFVRYLIDTDLRIRADDHWIPYYLFCTPCSLSYNIIGKVETMFQDQIFILHSVHLQNKVIPNWRHRVNPILNDTNYNGVSEIAKIYFSQLNRTDLEELYEKYKLDFELFHYSKEDYLNYISNY